jgi:hypothetical protein
MHEEIPFSRRSLLRATVVGLGVAVGGNVLLADRASADERELEQPLPGPTTQEQADIAKTNAETEQIKVKTDTDRLDAETARKKQDAEIDQINQEVNTDRSWRGIVADILPWATVGGAAFGGIKAYLATRKASRVQAEKDREERAEKVVTETRARFASARSRLVSEDDPNLWKGGDVDILEFSSPDCRSYHGEVFSLATSLLRKRRVSPLQTTPTEEHNNITTAFLQVIPGLRGAEVARQYAAQRTQVYPFSEQVFDYLATTSPVLAAEGIHMDGVAASGIDLSLVDLERATFRRAKLPRFIMAGGDLREADFTDAELKAASISGVSVEGLIVDRANLDGARFTEIDWSGVELWTASSLVGAVIDGTLGLTDEKIMGCLSS